MSTSTITSPYVPISPEGRSTTWRVVSNAGAGKTCLMRWRGATWQRRQSGVLPSWACGRRRGAAATAVAGARASSREAPPRGKLSQGVPQEPGRPGSWLGHQIARVTTVGVKWVLVPLLVLSLLVETGYAIRDNTTLLMSMGLVLGAAAAGLAHEVWVEVAPSESARMARVPWHLGILAVLFIALKAIVRPMWAGLLCTHVANGGLWQIIVLFFRWQQQKHFQEHVEDPGPATSA